MKAYSSLNTPSRLQSVSLIDRDYLAYPFRADAFSRSLQSIWQWLTHNVDEINVWTHQTAQGQTQWSAVNRRTGDALHRVTEDEIRQWVEQQINGSASA